MDTRSTTNRRLYRFGLFEADLEIGTLTRQGVPVKLQEQPFRILALLLESSGEILSRDELRKNIWPDGTYVEFDGSLNTALMKLRAALSDSADNPRFIETVPRKGYRFIAPVELCKIESPSITTAIRIEADEASLGQLGVPFAPEVSLQTQSASPKGRRLGPLWWEALLILAGVTALLTYGLWPRPEPRVIRVQQLTLTRDKSILGENSSPMAAASTSSFEM